MKNSTYVLIITLLVLVIVLGGAAMLYQNLGDQVSLDSLPTESAGETEPLELAPDFAVEDIEGNTHRLSDHIGTPVILNFWATWCGPCQNEMPEFEAAYQEYGDRIQFMMINLTDGYSDTVGSATQFVHDGGYTFPLFFDTSMEAAMNYGTSSIPVTCFIDAEGRLVYTQIGMISSDTLHRWIEAILPE